MFDQASATAPGMTFPLVGMTRCQNVPAQVYHANTFLLFLNTVENGSGMHFHRSTVKIHVSLDNAVVFGNANYDEFSIPEDQTNPQQPSVSQPKVEPRMTTESQVMLEAMKCRENMKEITSLTYKK